MSVTALLGKTSVASLKSCQEPRNATEAHCTTNLTQGIYWERHKGAAAESFCWGEKQHRLEPWGPCGERRVQLLGSGDALSRLEKGTVSLPTAFSTPTTNVVQRNTF